MNKIVSNITIINESDSYYGSGFSWLDIFISYISSEQMLALSFLFKPVPNLFYLYTLLVQSHNWTALNLWSDNYIFWLFQICSWSVCLYRLCDCDFSEEGCTPLSSALIYTSSHMRELDLSCNDAGDSGVKRLSAVLENLHCKLETLK